MTRSELSAFIIDIDNLHKGLPVAQERLLDIQNFICGNCYFPNDLVPDDDAKAIFAASVDTIGEAFHKTFVDVVTAGCVRMLGPIQPDPIEEE